MLNYIFQSFSAIPPECTKQDSSVRDAFECCKMPKLFESSLMSKCSEYIKSSQQKDEVFKGELLLLGMKLINKRFPRMLHV